LNVNHFAALNLAASIILPSTRYFATSLLIFGYFVVFWVFARTPRTSVCGTNCSNNYDYKYDDHSISIIQWQTGSDAADSSYRLAIIYNTIHIRLRMPANHQSEDFYGAAYIYKNEQRR